MSIENEKYVLTLIAQEISRKSKINHEISFCEIKIRGYSMYEIKFIVYNADIFDKHTICLPIGIIDTMPPVKIRDLIISALN